MTVTGAANVEISFREGLTDAERRYAQRSVAAFVEHSLAEAARARAAEAALTELADTLNGPLRRLVEDDAAAVEAAGRLRTEHVLRPRATDELQGDAEAAELFAPRPPANARSLDFFPPYDFVWSWHDGAGHPPHGQILSWRTGAVGLDARSGSLADGAPGLVAAHAGVGVVLPSTNPGKLKYPHAVLDPGRYSYAVKTVGLGGNATSEGGFDLAVFENGRFLVNAFSQLWRARISGNEERTGGDGPRPMTGPDVQFFMNPGAVYTFHAGIWVVTDRSTGLGAAAAQSLLQGTVNRMWMFG
ncbi:hypothetical protein ACFU3J_31220 [Streptomyces sp. NPDC057411]|uniref:hypothetical protein n=1 Tax=unclassified Streptomyces TaxID=2593676 RepID=UPI00363F4012